MGNNVPVAAYLSSFIGPRTGLHSRVHLIRLRIAGLREREYKFNIAEIGGGTGESSRRMPE